MIEQPTNPDPTAPKATPARVDYVEFAVPSGEAAKAFYAAAFGWTFQDWGPDYVSFNDGARDAGGLRVEAGRPASLVILYSDDLEATRAAVVAAGGTVIGPDLEFPGGKRFHFRDPFGNELAVWTKA